jgi:hypothetical protein
MQHRSQKPHQNATSPPAVAMCSRASQANMGQFWTPMGQKHPMHMGQISTI